MDNKKSVGQKNIIKTLIEKILRYIWAHAHKICYVYLYIGKEPPKKIVTLFDAWKIQRAINWFYLHHLMNPKANGSLFFIGKCYQALGNHRMALRYFKNAWDTDSYNAILFKEIGTECMASGQYEEGLRYALKEVSEYSNNGESVAQLAQLLLLNNKTEEARATILRAKALDDKNEFIDYVYKKILAANMQKR